MTVLVARTAKPNSRLAGGVVKVGRNPVLFLVVAGVRLLGIWQWEWRVA